jgi:23S rRNA (adenine2503-C2)-methyltransferase
MIQLRDSLIRVLLVRPRTLRQIMLELALIDGINDRLQDAEHLAEFCQEFYQKVPGVKLVVNLIPWNDISATSGPAAHYRKPNKESILAFQRLLVERNILCYVRTTRGDDESAACGQLATKTSTRVD